MKRLILIPLLLSAPLLWAAEKNTPAQPADLESRVQRLERVLGGKALVDMQLRLEQLQQEVQQLRGDLEQQNYQIKEIKGHQRDLYADIDRRLLALERGGAGNGGGANGGEQTTEPQGQVPSQEEQAAYQKGIDLLQEFKYGQAAQSFAAYLKAFPKGRYAPIALYWLADAYYSDRKYKQAISQYQRLLKDYPDNSKAVQARLKIGYSQAELKQWKAARQSMEAVIKLHPKSTEASLAQRYLQRLKQQGH
ncbi:MAG: tol-pal system protein YbgF [Gammaproteobacteria bacterium]|nr:tol-pal system protein YbgF [Gammaproteobacteria bacterium]